MIFLLNLKHLSEIVCCFVNYCILWVSLYRIIAVLTDTLKLRRVYFVQEMPLGQRFR